MGWDAKSKFIGGAIKVIVTWIYRTLKGAKKHGGFGKHLDHLEQVDEYNPQDKLLHKQCHKLQHKVLL